MKDKILNLIYKKLCEGFNTSFLTRIQFEKEFSEQQNLILASLASLTQTYYELKQSENPEVVKISKADYIIRYFNLYYYNHNAKYTVANLEELKKKYEYKFDYKAEEYYDYLNNENSDFVISLLDFLVSKTIENISLTENSFDLSIKYLFWNYFHNIYLKNKNDRWTQTDEIAKSPELIIKKFEEYYLSNVYLKLIDKAEKNLSDENLSGFETVIVNVGKRNYESVRAGWSTTNFEILNNGKQYNFSNSAKDEKGIRGECINIFIFQNKHLIKISITLDLVERTPYIINKDCEKITLKNECELVIVKHHGNETIVFDTRKDALAFQAKLLEIREGRKFN